MKSCFKCLIRLSSAQNMVWFHEGANNNHFETNTLLVVSSTQVLGAFVLVFIQAPTHAIIQISITQAFSIHFFCSYYSLFRWFHTYIAILLVRLVILSLYSHTWIHLQYLTNLVSLVSSWICESIPNSIFSYKYSN